MPAPGTHPGAERPLPEPSPRQRQIIRCTWDGMDNPAIAAHLGISPATVRWHQHLAYTRLGIEGTPVPRTKAAVWLWRQEHGGTR